MIGIDIGGTHTDGVYVKEGQIIGKIKTATTPDLEDGFRSVIQSLKVFGKISAIFLGTTHATNALLEGVGLAKVGVLRIAGQNPFIPPCAKWPSKLRDRLYCGSETISGGFECDGTPLSSFRWQEAKEALLKLQDKGAETVAITGLFSPLNPSQEQEVKSLTCLPTTLSHEMGGLNFLDRENGAILNAALTFVLKKGFEKLTQVLKEEGIIAPLLISQNNGSLMPLEKAIQYPVLTLSAGCTNSFIGASNLSKLSEAIIVDIGGTSSDIGALRNGLPRESLNQSEVGGVKLNFRMPDVISLAIGGGTRLDGEPSIARKLKTEGASFGGNILTLTCAAVKLGFKIEGARKEWVPLTVEEAEKTLAGFANTIEKACEKMKGGRNLPTLLAGGAAPLIHPFLKNSSLIPQAGIVNAYGATLGLMEGSVDEIVSLEERDKTLDRLLHKAFQKARERGGRAETLKVLEKEIIPCPYLPGHLARVKIVVGGKHPYHE